LLIKKYDVACFNRSYNSAGIAARLALIRFAPRRLGEKAMARDQANSKDTVQRCFRFQRYWMNKHRDSDLGVTGSGESEWAERLKATLLFLLWALSAEFKQGLLNAEM
jgi:hypothetical protein